MKPGSRPVFWLCVWGLLVAPGAARSVATPQNIDQPRMLVHEMLGTWDVKEWMWTGPGTKPTPLPDAVADRRAVGDTFVQETMSTSPGAANAFSRHATFGFNPINRQFEYASIDSRAPQLMSERSGKDRGEPDGSLDLAGGMFFTPQWGEMKNVTFRYRLVVGSIRNNSQEVDLCLTPISASGPPEFVAFRYLYTRRR